jgi:hypothetical protein
LSRHLSETDCREIADLIASYRGIITWNDVIALGEEVTSKTYSRQTLEKKDDIRTAYNVVIGKDQGQGVGRHSKKPKSKELMVAEDRILRLVAKVELLEAIDAKHREQFIVWAENARKKGLSEADLNKELPVLHRKSNRKDLP